MPLSMVMGERLASLLRLLAELRREAFFIPMFEVVWMILMVASSILDVVCTVSYFFSFTCNRAAGTDAI